MAWFFLELIVKSMALEQARLFYHSLPLGILIKCHGIPAISIQNDLA
jgi:hypothetical protein